MNSSSLPTLGDARLLPKAERVIILTCLIVILGVYLFYPFQSPLIGKTIAGWTWLGGGAFGYSLSKRLAPFVFLGLLYVAFRRSKHLTLSPSLWGLVPLAIGLFLLWAGLRASLPHFALAGAPFIVLGFTYYLAGPKIAKFVIFPAFVLCFAIPIPALEFFLPVRMETFTTQMTYQISHLLGLDLTLDGTTTIIAKGSSMDLTRSFGIRLIMFTLLSASTLAYLTQRSLWKQCLLLAITVPLLFLYMSLKFVLFLFLAEHGHEDLAKQLFHDWTSLLPFILTIATIFLIGHFLKRASILNSRKNSTSLPE